MKFNLNIKHNTVIFAMLVAFCVIAFIASAHSEETYIEIGTKAELEAFRDRVNNGETTLNAKLTADIDLQGSEAQQWVPIGNESRKYSGIFDGQDHKISGLYINSKKDFQGLFGYLKGAKIKCLIVKVNVTGGHYTGGICGRADNVTLNKCITNGNVTGVYSYVGGICGFVDSTNITFCINRMNVNGYDYTGGVCGHAANSKVTDCVNEGYIILFDEARVYSGAGICGEADSSKIVNCINKGNVKSCYKYSSTYYYHKSTGGICGLATSETAISNCVNQGNIMGDEMTGGVLGWANSDVWVTNCVNEGRVEGKNDTGGICGLCYSFNVGAINNCVNTGEIFGTSDAGWIIGGSHTNSGVMQIANCGYYNIGGNVTEIVGKITGDGTTKITNTKGYAAYNVPAASAIITLDTVIIGSTKPIVTVYPTDAYYNGGINYAFSSSNTAIASINRSKVFGNAKGNTIISGEVSNLLGASKVVIAKEIKVIDAVDSTFMVIAQEDGAIPGDTIMAKIKILFKNLGERLVTGINMQLNLSGKMWSDILEIVFAEKSDISGAKEPSVFSDNTINFKLVNYEGVSFEEGKYYDFGTVCYKVKKNAPISELTKIFISLPTYTLSDSTEKIAETIGTDICVYQPVTEINIISKSSTKTMLVGNRLQLEAVLLPENAENKDIQWLSSDETIATVDANGLVSAKLIPNKTANVTITAKALDGSEVTDKIILTVIRPKVVGLNFAQATYELGQSKNLYTELTAVPVIALKPAANEIIWQSSNPNFAIDANGVISIVIPTEEQQSTTVTATHINEDSEIVTASCTVKSKPPKVTLNLATKLEGRQSGGGTGTNVEPIEVWLYNSANKPLWNGSGTTDANGNISFEIDSSLLTAGQSVKLWIKGERYLAKLLIQTVTLSGSNWNVTMSEKLKGADADGSNRVDLFDFDILLNSFQKKKTSPLYDYRADFDESARVDLFDFDILLANFQKKGDKQPQAAVTMLMTAAARKGSTDTAMEVLNTETAKIAEEALENSTATDEETQEEEILYAVQNATGAELKAENPATSSANSSSDSNSGSSSSGGGCNAGYGALALMFAIPLIFKKRK